MKWMAIGALALLMACNQPAPTKAPEEAAVATAPNAATLAAYAAPLQGPDQTDNAANVAKVIPLDRDDAKLYSLTGGDPAINGDYAMLGVFISPDGWFTYKIGDFNFWEIVEQSPARVVVKVSHSAVVQETGEIVTYGQKLAVALPPVTEDSTTLPKEVQVTPVE